MSRHSVALSPSLGVRVPSLHSPTTSQPLLLDAADAAPLAALSPPSAFDSCSLILLDQDALPFPSSPLAPTGPCQQQAAAGSQPSRWGQGMGLMTSAASLQVAPSLELALDLERAGLSLLDPTELEGGPAASASHLSTPGTDWDVGCSPWAASCGSWEGLLQPETTPSPFATTWSSPQTPIQVTAPQPFHSPSVMLPLGAVVQPAAAATAPWGLDVQQKETSGGPLQAGPLAAVTEASREAWEKYEAGGSGPSQVLVPLVETPVTPPAEPGSPVAVIAQQAAMALRPYMGTAAAAEGTAARSSTSWAVSSHLEEARVPRVASTANFGGLQAEQAAGPPQGAGEGGSVLMQKSQEAEETAGPLPRIKSASDMSDLGKCHLPHISLLTPPHLRRGKGGRQAAPDPRLENPGMDPKRAKRILANRLSAAKSKLKQKSRVQGLQQQLEQACNKRAALAAELEEYVSACAAQEQQHAELSTQIQALQAHPGTLAW